MKFIFDFDDVIFYTTKHRKERMFSFLEKAGISRAELEEYYKKERERGFSLKKCIDYFFTQGKIKKDSRGDLYEEIMRESKNFINQKLLDTIEKIGKENCYLITFGDNEFQRAKIERIERINVASLFSKIIVVQDSKKEVVEKICAKHKNEEVIFVDDKAYHFQDLDFVKYPNLKTILYDEQGLKKLMHIKEIL